MNRFQTKSALIFAVLVLVSLVAIAAETLVEGTVSLSSGDACDGAIIVLEDQETEIVEYSAISNHRGRFRIEDPVPGTYTVRVTAIDCDTTETSLTIETGGTYTLDFTLTNEYDQSEQGDGPR